jgi:cellulose synthase operon protein C
MSKKYITGLFLCDLSDLCVSGVSESPGRFTTETQGGLGRNQTISGLVKQHCSSRGANSLAPRLQPGDRGSSNSPLNRFNGFSDSPPRKTVETVRGVVAWSLHNRAKATVLMRSLRVINAFELRKNFVRKTRTYELPRQRSLRWPRALRLSASLLIVTFLSIAIFNPRDVVTAGNDTKNNQTPVDEKSALIESALYTRVEFFGAQALVPYPTAEARNRLAEIHTKYPDDPQIDLKLSQLDEKLGRGPEALEEMRAFVEHEPDKTKGLEAMAAFHDRRAEFAAEGEVLERLLQVAPPERRVEIFGRLIDLAQAHLLKKYLAPAFYEQTIAQNPSVFELIEQLSQKLIEERNYPEALKVVRHYQESFPDRRAFLIEREATILDEIGQPREAEAAYTKAFDPFWPTELSDSFYQFLKDHDRFRAYGRELRQAFRRNPADFHTAVKLLHYSKQSYEESPDVFVKLEKARAARNIGWKQDELVTITRLLIAGGYADAASRFLYTLYLKGEMKLGSTLRAKVLYQLFELLSDAKAERLSLTRGDLRFYQDIGTADPHPGMLGGILSLILSDTNPKKEFQTEEDEAVKHFNRAAAYRIFTAYKQEYPTAPELAQMYLDIVRLYTATKETTVAAEALKEFENRYADAPQYPEVALKLADSYVAAGKFAEERALYQRILDYLGQHRHQGAPLVPSSGQSQNTGPNATFPALAIDSEPTAVKPSVIHHPPASNVGIDIPEPTTNETGTNTSYNGYSNSRYTDHLTVEDSSPNARTTLSTNSTPNLNSVDYPTVLARYVASLDKENRTPDILALYSSEIKKYDTEQGLYEQMLQWLGQTNMVEEQLRVYQETLKKFPTTMWRDRMARWFLRQKRTQEFETFSRDLVGKLDNDEAETYLHRFVDSGANLTASSFDVNLYRSLYLLAHERFPHDLSLVNGLLRFYSTHKEWTQWRALVAEYYFESREIRDQFLSQLASSGELRAFFERARETCDKAQSDAAGQSLLPYKLFRGDAAVWLSNYEEAISAYRELNRLYPNTPEFSERLISFTRSLGQHDRRLLEESGDAAHALADAVPAAAQYRTRAGEIQAELGDYGRARAEWEQLIPLGRGRAETYLDTATIYWDYFQYDEALRTIQALRRQSNDETLFAFQAGVIMEDKHQLRPAVAEYIKALAGGDSEDARVADIARARKRLVTLSKRPGVWEQIGFAFNQERRRNDNWEFVLEYVDFLDEAKRWPVASALLRQEIARRDSQKFLRRARALFADKQEASGEIAALRRLETVTHNRRLAISYRLQLAETHERLGQRAVAATVLRELVQKFPRNYGVLSETADFYWRMGLRENSLTVLRSGMQRGLGRFHYVFGRKLAARHLDLNRQADAERVLTKLHLEDRLNPEVFHELARLYVRTGNQVALRGNFRATVGAIKQQDLDIKAIHAQVAELRGQMIEAFTRLKDYQSGAEQHIEIINRDPEDQDNVDAAINYAKRYGGAETLLNYYQRTASQAYKNYRWNVVLARIYEAKGDLGNAALQYRAALDNQPEMLELYDALADINLRAKDYDDAVTALNRAAELSNDDPRYIKRLVDALVRAGRHREAEIARRKLPPEESKKLSLGDRFAEAARLRGTEKKRAIAAYREAFNAVLAEPFKHELKATEIAGYVQTIRDEEPLDQIMDRLWELRSRMLAESVRPNNPQAGKARALLQVIDGAVPEAVGSLAAERATGDELSALFGFLKQKIEVTLQDRGDSTATLAFLENLGRRAGFGVLAEQIMLHQKDIAYSLADWSIYHSRLKTVADFYSERGAYRQVIEILEAERLRDPARDAFEYWRLIAENARLIGDRERELQALRENYRKPSSSPALLSTSLEPMVDRYFEALYEKGETGRNELLSCIQQPTAHRLQLVNFLLRKGEKELAHLAIEHTSLSDAWKFSRHAETSLALREFDASNERYFVSALQVQPIGEWVKQKPDTARQLVGDDWFHLSKTYGQWLYLPANGQSRAKSRLFLPAMIENRPQDVNEQARLGRWYMGQKDAALAIEHLRLAHEAEPENKGIVADLGSAFFLLGDKRRANELWEEIIRDEPSLDDCKLYLETLARYDLSDPARRRLTPLLTKRLAENFLDLDDYDSDESTQELERMKALIRALHASFAEKDAEGSKPLSPANEAIRAAFFRGLCEAAPDNRFLPELLISEGLVAPGEAAPFYRLLIARSSGLSSYDRDYAYTAQQQKSWDAAGMEEAVDHETDYKASEPDSKRIRWQKEFLAYLLELNQPVEARQLITAIESSIKHRYARPVWLRLASLRLQIRSGGMAQAWDEIAHLVGIKTNANLTSIKPPSIERLNEVSALLRSEGHEAEARALIEAAYARQIALTQYEPAYFVGLASMAFDRGDGPLGLKWLQWMVNLSQEDLTAETAAELAALPLVKRHAVEESAAELPPGAQGIEQVQALRVAAETAAEFSQFEAALVYRRQLLSLSPDNEENRIELVRILAVSKRTEEAIKSLASIIGDRTTTRVARWQAVWLAPEITGSRPELWASLREQVRSLNLTDSEMAAALQSLSLAATGQSDEAIKLVGSTESSNPNVYLRFLRAFLEKQAGHQVDALASFTRALSSSRESDVGQAFGFSEAEPLEQVVGLYLSQNQLRAALKLAERVTALQQKGSPSESEESKQDSVEIEVSEVDQKKYQTLRVRALARQRNARAELLELLSVAAEQIGDIERAVELEQARLGLLVKVADKRTAELRLERLREMLRAVERPGQPPLVIDRALVASR